jgi:hypothetical protein
VEAVVTDLDGTVVRRDGTVSAATLRAADALKTLGVPLVAATARTPLGVQALPTLVPRLTFAVCCNGAVGWVPADGTLAWIERLPRKLVSDLVSYLAAELLEAGAAVFDGRQWRVTERYRAIRTPGHKGPISIVDLAALAQADACSMVVCQPGWSAPQTLAALVSAGFAPGRVTLSYAGSQFVEVTAASVDKASGVARALLTVGASPERSIVFGDMPIDVPMFSVVGHSVAMAGAPGEVLSAATSRAESVEDDGFARTLIRLGLVRP